MNNSDAVVWLIIGIIIVLICCACFCMHNFESMSRTISFNRAPETRRATVKPKMHNVV